MKVVGDPIKGNTFSDFMPPEVLVLPPGFMLCMDTYPAKTWTIAPQAEGSRAPMGALCADSWNGEGLPPVGTVCEYNWRGEWHRVMVAARVQGFSDRQEVIVQLDGDWNYDHRPSLFRPVRTAEQVALKEIEEAVDSYNTDIDCSAAICATVKAMLGAGYRKQEQSK